jgi:hypothetical protein
VIGAVLLAAMIIAALQAAVVVFRAAFAVVVVGPVGLFLSFLDQPRRRPIVLLRHGEMIPF